MQSIKHANLTDIGAVRQNNEDYAWSGINKYNNMAGIVCDGLGGYKGGSAASEITVNVFCERFMNTDLSAYSNEQISNWMENVITAARAQISEHIKTNPKLLNMATTLVCALIINQKAYIFNIGDSRCWSINKNGEILQITLDQNLYNYLTNINAPKEVFAKHHDNLYAITQFVGAQTKKIIKADVFVKTLQKGDYIILTSDGCHNFIDINEVWSTIKFDSERLEKACNAVICKALSNSSNDNLSIVILGV